MTEMPTTLSQRQESILAWSVIILFVFILGVLATIWFCIVTISFEELRRELVPKYAAALLGLPVAGWGAFILVFVFRQTQGPIEFEAFTIKLKGAAGPIVLWILAFLATAAAIKILS